MRYIHLTLLVLFSLGIPFSTEWLLTYFMSCAGIHMWLSIQLLVGLRDSELDPDIDQVQAGIQSVVMNVMTFIILFMSDYGMYVFAGLPFVLGHAVTVTMSLLVLTGHIEIVSPNDIEEDDIED